MPSINEVWEQALQINANLATLHNDMVALRGCCQANTGRLDESNDWLEELRNLVSHGFAAVTEGLVGIQARQDVTNRLLLHQIQQQDAMICILEKISRNTCALLDEADLQSERQAAIQGSSEALAHMFATANPDARLVHERHLADRTRMDECCPPQPRKPRCRYEPCERPPERPTPNMPAEGPRLTHVASAVVRRTDEPSSPE